MENDLLTPTDKIWVQGAHLSRAKLRLRRAILEFCAAHARFRADELRAFVARQAGPAAPGSADRVLRALRQDGELNYRVLSRRESLYEVIPR